MLCVTVDLRLVATPSRVFSESWKAFRISRSSSNACLAVFRSTSFFESFSCVALSWPLVCFSSSSRCIRRPILWSYSSRTLRSLLSMISTCFLASTSSVLRISFSACIMFMLSSERWIPFFSRVAKRSAFSRSISPTYSLRRAFLVMRWLSSGLFRMDLARRA